MGIDAGDGLLKSSDRISIRDHLALILDELGDNGRSATDQNSKEDVDELGRPIRGGTPLHDIPRTLRYAAASRAVASGARPHPPHRRAAGPSRRIRPGDAPALHRRHLVWGLRARGPHPAAPRGGLAQGLVALSGPR